MAAHGVAAETYVKCVTNSNTRRTSGSETGRDRELIQSNARDTGESNLLMYKKGEGGRPGTHSNSLLRDGHGPEKGAWAPIYSNQLKPPWFQWVTDVNARLPPSYYLVQTLFTLEIQNGLEIHCTL